MKKNQSKYIVGSEVISVTTVTCRSEEIADVLFIHGAGKATKDRYFYLADFLCELNRSSILFDFSGHGESSGDITNSSLRKRLTEANEISNLLSKDKPITVIATSMGGHIAVKLFDTLKVQNLILFCPAAYSDDAFELNFSSAFTNEIRKNESWKKSGVFEIIRSFEGNLLIVIGEEDKVIPKGVIDSFFKNATNTNKKKLLVLPNAPHGLHFWLNDNKEQMQTVKDAIIDILK